LAVLLSSFVCFSLQADVVYSPGNNPPQNLATDFPHVAVFGRISNPDIRSLEEAIEKVRNASGGHFDGAGNKSITVFPNSPGGSLLTGIELGRIIRKNNVGVWVLNGECSSACVFMMSGGIDRSAYNSRIGVHRPTLRDFGLADLDISQARAKYKKITKYSRQYLIEMGVSPRLMDAMLAVPSSSIKYLSESEMKDFNLLGKDAAYEEWARAKNMKSGGKLTIFTEYVFFCQEKYDAVTCIDFLKEDGVNQTVLDFLRQCMKKYSPLTCSTLLE